MVGVQRGLKSDRLWFAESFVAMAAPDPCDPWWVATPVLGAFVQANTAVEVATDRGSPLVLPPQQQVLTSPPVLVLASPAALPDGVVKEVGVGEVDFFAAQVGRFTVFVAQFRSSQFW